MKKTIILMLGLMISAAAVFASPVIKYETKGKETKIENFVKKNKIICKDNVRFINETDQRISFVVYGKKSETAEREYLCRVQVSGNDTELKSPAKKVKKFKYIDLICENGEADISLVSCEHNDMYFYISGFKANPAKTPTAVNDR